MLSDRCVSANEIPQLLWDRYAPVAVADTPPAIRLTNREPWLGIPCGKEALVVGRAIPLGLVGAVTIRHRARPPDSSQLVLAQVTFAPRAKRRLIRFPISKQPQVVAVAVALRFGWLVAVPCRADIDLLTSRLCSSGITGPKHTSIVHLALSSGVFVSVASGDAADPLHEVEGIGRL